MKLLVIRTGYLIFGTVCVLKFSSVLANLSDINCQDDVQKLCFVEETGLRLRVLVKPQSNVYIQENENSAQTRSNVPAFEVFYIFELD